MIDEVGNAQGGGTKARVDGQLGMGCGLVGVPHQGGINFTETVYQTQSNLLVNFYESNGD